MKRPPSSGWTSPRCGHPSMWPPLDVATLNPQPRPWRSGNHHCLKPGKGRPKSRVGSNPREALFRKNERPKMDVSPLQCTKNHPKMHQKPPKKCTKSDRFWIGFCTRHLGYCDKMVTEKCAWTGWLEWSGWSGLSVCEIFISLHNLRML